ncbi:unnamed protein product [Brassica oleracea var. botrytis]
MTESSDAGASMASKIGNLRLASDIDINDHIDLSGKPCRVIDLYTKRGLSLTHDLTSLLTHHKYINWLLRAENCSHFHRVCYSRCEP